MSIATVYRVCGSLILMSLACMGCVQAEVENRPIITKELKDSPNFIKVDKVSSRINEESIYSSIINYSRNPTLDITNRMTCGHETTHMINNDLRNNLQAGNKINAFYLPIGWAFATPEPNFRKSKVKEFVPSDLRGPRYSLYLEGSRDWDDRPLYVMDEWCSYINGAMVGIDDVKNNRYRDGWTDGVYGCLEFSVYGLALCMATEKYDNNYWNTNVEFKSFMNWNLKRAYNTYVAGKDFSQFKYDKQEDYLQRFQQSSSAQAMRNFANTHFNGTWVK